MGKNTSPTMTEDRVMIPGHRRNHNVLRTSFSAKVSEAFQESEGRDGSAVRVSMGMKLTPNRGMRALGFRLSWGERERERQIILFNGNGNHFPHIYILVVFPPCTKTFYNIT